MQKRTLLIFGLIVNLLIGIFNFSVVNAQISYTGSITGIVHNQANSLGQKYASNKLNSVHNKYDFLWLDSATNITNTCGITKGQDRKAIIGNCEFVYKGIKYKDYTFDLKIKFSDINNAGLNYNNDPSFENHVNLQMGPVGTNFKLSYVVELYYANTNNKVEFNGFPHYLGLYDPDHTDVKSSDMSEWYWVDNAREKASYHNSNFDMSFSFEDTYVVENNTFINQKLDTTWGDRYIFDIGDAPNGDGNVLIFKGTSKITNTAAISTDTGFSSDLAYILIDNKMQRAQIRYYDNTTGTNVLLEEELVSGPSNTAINYSTQTIINKYKNQGYMLISDGFPINATFDNDLTKDQVYDVILSKQGTAKVLYIDQDQNNVVLEEKTGISGMHDSSIAAAYLQRMNDTQHWIDSGYTVAVDEFNTKNPKFIAGQLQVVNIYLKHTYTTVNKDTYEKDKCLNKSCTVKQPEKGC